MLCKRNVCFDEYYYPSYFIGTEFTNTIHASLFITFPSFPLYLVINFAVLFIFQELNFTAQNNNEDNDDDDDNNTLFCFPLHYFLL